MFRMGFEMIVYGDRQMRTLVFEKEYGVSIDDFEDITQIDRFIEEKLGHPLTVTDRRTSFTMRGGNVFRVRDVTREHLEKEIDESIKEVEAQEARLQAQERE